MGAPPTTLTFLFTDIEGSTRLWERQPEAMRVAIQRHDEILCQAIEGHGGRIFRTIGDAFCASFSAAPAAIAAATEAQRSLYAERWDLESPIRIRIALHTGEAEENRGDYLGASLNHIGRLLPACHGGQVLLTLITEELVKDSLPAGVSLRDLEMHRFRDLIHPEHVFQLIIDGLPSDFPPLKSLDVYPNNLPVQLTSFVGREHELSEIKNLLTDQRLLTLTGPGGTGKTRIAIQAAAELMDSFPDGAWFIELAPLSRPDLILQGIAKILNIREEPNRLLKDILIDVLRQKKLLLILDNCEHLIEACAFLTNELLHACPEIKILTSSREMLGISGEIVMRVPSLSFPELKPSSSLEEIARSEAVQLFVERATALQPSFSLTPQNAAPVAQIVQRLDGIPLAIELAAARVRLLTPEQIDARLDDRFRLLTGGSRTALPRQQTLEALFDWSYDLLSAEERVFFSYLSVFSGGWSLEAAEALCMGSGEEELGDFDVLDLLGQLVNKSLVVADRQGPEARYRMLETTRQYAQKKLVESGKAMEIRRRHMLYYARLPRASWSEVSKDGFRWFMDRENWLRAELDNIRSAQEWALDHDLDTALLFVGGFLLIWGVIGLAREMRNYVEAVLKRVEGLPEYQGELSPERKKLLAYAWLAHAALSENLGQNLDALQSSKMAVEYARSTEDFFVQSISLTILAESAGLTGDVDLAYASGQESIAIARRAGSQWGIAMTLVSTAAYALIPIGDIERARIYTEEGTRYFKELNDPWGNALSQMVSGINSVQSGDYTAARQSFVKSLASYQALGDIYFTNVSRSGLADVARLERQYEQSIALYRDTIEIWRALGNLGAMARCLECIAFIYRAKAEERPPEDRLSSLSCAAQLLGAAEAIRKENRTPMNPIEQAEYDREMAALRSLAGQKQDTLASYEEAWSIGRRIQSVDAVISYLKEISEN